MCTITRLGFTVSFKEMAYERTWCDYLTPCPYRNEKGDLGGIFIGDYDCSCCPNHAGDDYRNHVVLCTHKSQEAKK